MSRLLPLIIFTAVLFLIDLYAFQAIRTVMQNSGIALKRTVSVVYWIVSAMCIGSVWYFTFYDWYSLPKILRVYMFSSMIVFYVPKLFVIVFLLIDDIIRGGRLVASFVTNERSSISGKGISRSQFLAQTGLLISGFFLFQFVYGMVRTAYNYQVRKVKIPVKNLPGAFAGMKIVHISDIHAGSFTVKEPLRDAVRLINEQNADLIFFTGDLVNNRSDEVLPYIDVFSELNAKHGVFSIFGNHDYGDYYDWHQDKEKAAVLKADNLKMLEEVHQKLGWTLLRDQNVLLGEKENQLAIIGVNNCGYIGHFQRYGDLKKASEGTESAKAKLLLSHDPSHWKGEVTKDFSDIDITFSGHTHGFQFGFEIPGLRWSPAKYMYPQWAGLYQEGTQSLYVNRGLGFLAYNGRVGIPPEITVVELVRA